MTTFNPTVQTSSFPLDVSRLPDVSRTLLGILHARATEAARANPIVTDALSGEILSRIPYDFAALEGSTIAEASRLAVAIRTEIFDETVLLFMHRHPDGVIANLGAGLDTKFARLDNGRVRWIDVDLPEVIELRRGFFRETARYRMLGCRIEDSAWVDEIEPAENVLLLAEGVLMYVPKPDVKAIVHECVERFSGPNFLLEAISTLVYDGQHATGNPELTAGVAPPCWSLDDAAEFADWHPALRCTKEFAFMSRYEHRWRSAIPPRFAGRPLRKEWSNTAYFLRCA